jgi:hypothetical protein
MSTKITNDTIGIEPETSRFVSAVPQTTAPPRALGNVQKQKNALMFKLGRQLFF